MWGIAETAWTCLHTFFLRIWTLFTVWDQNYLVWLLEVSKRAAVLKYFCGYAFYCFLTFCSDKLQNFVMLAMMAIPDTRNDLSSEESCESIGGSECKMPKIENEEEYAFKPFQFHELWPRNRGRIPKPRSGHRIVADEASFYSFGGYLEETDPMSSGEDEVSVPVLFKELWQFNLSSSTWEHLPTEGETPKELASHSAVMYGNYMVVFGGTGVPFGTSSSNSMTVCDLRTKRWKKVHTTGTPPVPQYGQAIVLDKSRNSFYVIGGTTGYDYSMDVHRLNMNTFEWETLFASKGDPREPPPRYRHEVAFDGRRIFILGGGTAAKAFELTPIPVFDVEKKTWTEVETLPDQNAVSKFPRSRKCQGAVQRGDDVYVCGGYNSKRIFTDLWKLNLKSLQWTKLPVEMPTPVYFHSTALTRAGCLVMFGGVTDVQSTTRTNQVFKVWLTVPSLKEICWEALVHYRPKIATKSKSQLLDEGIPPQFVNRISPM